MDSSKAPVEPEPVPEVGQATAAPLAKTTSRLNPSAKEWDLWVEQTPVEKRGILNPDGKALLVISEIKGPRRPPRGWLPYRFASPSTCNLSMSSRKRWISPAIRFGASLLGLVPKSNRRRAVSLSGLGFDVFPA
ncbi:hypothetical protein LWI29_030360 [Acer saccharum]|uniref:Uncharacterized protein n=1 Tax=Acer saccharum TaxID=4024 RepID=A0AA39VLB4_ACESA|nr:hypothetical protein LWI29_030360 [Acer saccharum]